MLAQQHVALLVCSWESHEGSRGADACICDVVDEMSQQLLHKLQLMLRNIIKLNIEHCKQFQPFDIDICTDSAPVSHSVLQPMFVGFHFAMAVNSSSSSHFQVLLLGLGHEGFDKCCIS